MQTFPQQIFISDQRLIAIAGAAHKTAKVKVRRTPRRRGAQIAALERYCMAWLQIGYPLIGIANAL
jgi:hypothetical protein